MKNLIPVAAAVALTSCTAGVGVELIAGAIVPDRQHPPSELDTGTGSCGEFASAPQPQPPDQGRGSDRRQ